MSLSRSISWPTPGEGRSGDSGGSRSGDAADGAAAEAAAAGFDDSEESAEAALARMTDGDGLGGVSMEKLMAMIKAVAAARLVRKDKVPSRIIRGAPPARDPRRTLPLTRAGAGLYLGSIGAAFTREVLEELGITHVLCAAANIKPRCVERGGGGRGSAPTRPAARRHTDAFQYMTLDVLDSPTALINKHFERSFEFIDK